MEDRGPSCRDRWLTRRQRPRPQQRQPRVSRPFFIQQYNLLPSFSEIAAVKVVILSGPFLAFYSIAPEKKPDYEKHF